MKSYQLTEHIGGNMASRYYIDGKRVSYESFERIREEAYNRGNLGCFSTVAKQHGTTFRRINRSVATI